MLSKIFRAFSVSSLKELSSQKIVLSSVKPNEEYRDWSLRLACFALGKCPFLFRGFLPRENHVTKKLSLYNFIKNANILHNPIMVKLYSNILKTSNTEEFPEFMCQGDGKILIYHTMNANMLREIDSNYLNIIVLSMFALMKLPFIIPLLLICSGFEVFH